MVSLSVIVILPPFPTFSHGSHFQLNCYSIHDAAHYPQSTRQIRARCCQRTLASRVERRVMVSFPVLFIPPPPFKTFSHSFFFQWNCYPVCNASGLPSAGKANKSPPLPSPARMLRGEGSDGELFSHLYFPSPHSTLVLTDSFSNIIAILLADQAVLTQLIMGRKISAPAAIPCLHVAWRRKWRWVLLSFPPLFATFLKPNKILSRRPCRPPSLIQSREQRPATTIPTSEVCGEGGDIEFPFVFFHYFKCFLTAFFSIKLLFSGWLGLLFFIFISPPHLNFTMSYVPIKNVSQNFYFVLLIS
jgi:hypothetical protein